MKVLFITVIDIKSIENHGIYEDLLREFVKNGHEIFIVSPTERRNGQDTHVIYEKDCSILKVRTGNVQKVNMIEKGISTVLLQGQLINAVKKYYKDVKFDLVLYSTPPVTFARVVEYVKKRDNAKTYLMLKDIWPDAAVDIGVLKKTGIWGIVYNYFKRKEKRLYEVSDYIGCMSQANVDYVLKHNPEIPAEKVMICPNSIEVLDVEVSEEEKRKIREKYEIPTNKKVFVYGGNLGKPQGIDFMIECLKSQSKNQEVFFLIVGDGTEYSKIENYVNADKPTNVRLMKRLPKEDYDLMIAACDVGMIFLDHRFTIPNFPSRLLGYMQAKLPVLAVTDPNTDIGKVIVEGGFGCWCESNDVGTFARFMKRYAEENLREIVGENTFKYLKENYDVAQAYEIIMEHMRL